ncbi:MAG TPA: hypothetical protein VK894_09085 [Jiangellales bacterium]|nr:hypothetical protein [Jiangellales bacterium]
MPGTLLRRTGPRPVGVVPAVAGAGVMGYFALMLTLSVIAHVVLGIE